MRAFVLATLLAVAAAQQLPAVLLARQGTLQGNPRFNLAGTSQTNNLNDNRQTFFTQSQESQFQSGVSGSADEQNTQFQSGASFGQEQGSRFQAGASLGQAEASQFQAGSSVSGQSQNAQQQSTFSAATRDQNTQFQSGSSSFSGQNQNTQARSGSSSSRQGLSQAQSGASFSGQEQRTRFQSSSSQVEASQRQQTGEFSSVVNGVFEPLNLPAGASLILGPIDTSFACADRPYGYYADESNSCRIFHICNPYLFDDGRIETVQYSFMCGEGAVFDQKELTCVEQFAALPCAESSFFFSRNEEFGRVEEKL